MAEQPHVKKLEVGGQKSDVSILVAGLTAAGATMHAAGAPDNRQLLTDNSVRGREPSGFTLMELLVVVGIIVIVAAFVTPAFTSLSKSSGRKAAISNLVSGIERARSQAVKDGRYTYVVFAAQPVGSTSTIIDKTMLDRYFYHSFAIFEDDAADPTKPKVQLTPWKTLPIGVSLRSAISSAPWTSDIPFAFTPAGAAITQNFPYLRFNGNGEADAPTVTPIQVGIFEGYVTGTSDKATSSTNFTQTVTISPHTGRAEYIP